MLYNSRGIKMMKKISLLLLILCAFACLLPVTALSSADSPRIDSARILVGKDLTLRIFVRADSEEDIGVSIDRGGKRQAAPGAYDVESGLWSFSYGGILPQYMTQEIKITLQSGGEEKDSKSFTVRDYFDSLHLSGAEGLGLCDEVFSSLKRLLADLLVYGGAAQEYSRENASDPADSLHWVSAEKSSDPLAAASEYEALIPRVRADRIVSAGLVLQSSVRFRLCVFAPHADSLIISDGESTQTYLLSEYEKDGVFYYIDSRGLKNNEFSKAFTFELSKEGETCEKLRYSVFSYVARMNGQESLSDLIKGIYNLGLSAEEYGRVSALHVPAAAATENRVDPTYYKNGSYDSVIYCSECGRELSREEVTVSRLEIPDEDKAILLAQKNHVRDAALADTENPLPTFVQITDCHGDEICFENAVSLAGEIGADAILGTGDMVRYYGTDDFSYVTDALSGVAMPYLSVIGNHESYLRNANNPMTEQAMYERFISPFAVNSGYIFDTAVDSPTYYYRDFPEQSIRVIAVNEYQYRGPIPTSVRHYYTEQLAFVADALNTAPCGYGVIVLMHTPEQETASSDGYEKFYQNNIKYKNVNGDIAPIYDLVDAYISKTAISKTYKNETEGANVATFTVNADFSGRPDSEFICYVTGHLHRDAIHYANDAYKIKNKPVLKNRQLVICSVCSGSVTKDSNISANSDLPRTDGTYTKDALNVISVDRERGVVIVTRYGSDTPKDGSPIRDVITLPYR